MPASRVRCSSTAFSLPIVDRSLHLAALLCPSTSLPLPSRCLPLPLRYLPLALPPPFLDRPLRLQALTTTSSVCRPTTAGETNGRTAVPTTRRSACEASLPAACTPPSRCSGRESATAALSTMLLRCFPRCCLRSSLCLSSADEAVRCDRRPARAAAAAAACEERGGWPSDIPIHRLELLAGDCLLFTERITHSTVPWRGAGDRRTMFFKYVQHDMKWTGSNLYDLEQPGLVSLLHRQSSLAPHPSQPTDPVARDHPLTTGHDATSLSAGCLLAR